jgi:hypothetical protein
LSFKVTQNFLSTFLEIGTNATKFIFSMPYRGTNANAWNRI